MERIDSFNCSEKLTEMYVFRIFYRNKTKISNRPRTFRMESAPFYHREVCRSVMYIEVDDLKARGFEIVSYYVDVQLVPDVEKQF